MSDIGQNAGQNAGRRTNAGLPTKSNLADVALKQVGLWRALGESHVNIIDPAVAHEMLEKLPLGQAHLMSFERIPFGPLAPLRRLPGMTTKPQLDDCLSS
jgi:hypothetical protein